MTAGRRDGQTDDNRAFFTVMSACFRCKSASLQVYNSVFGARSTARLHHFAYCVDDVDAAETEAQRGRCK